MTIDLAKWMNGVLIDWGISPKLANTLDETIVVVLMVFVALGLDLVFQLILGGGMHRYIKKSPHLWNTLMMKRKVVKYVIHLCAGILVYFLLPMAFVHGKEVLRVAEKICMIYIIVMIIFTVNGFILMLLDIYETRDTSRNRPMRGFAQVLEVVVFFIGFIIIISILMGKSPAALLTGLGASAAILMLVFKDTILGFVAGIQLSANDMLRIGDWIQLPSGDANGTVEEITLNTVKVRNWDNTISTVPPYNLVSNVFQNWRGMVESDGRQVSKRIFLDIMTIKFCDGDMLDRLRKSIPLMADYQPPVGVTPTNVQIYRAYIERYLDSLPVVNQDLDLIISQKEMDELGLPIMVYFFSRNKAWKEFEIIQSDIFDHLMAMVPSFDLKLYQYIE